METERTPNRPIADLANPMANKAALGRTTPPPSMAVVLTGSASGAVVESFDPTAQSATNQTISALFSEDITLTVPILTISR
jgi:hypothetical protein